MNIGSKISKNFAFELEFLYFLTSFSDGIDWFEFHMVSSWCKVDHNPSHSIGLTILNFLIFDFRIYNIHHIKDEDEDEDE